MDRLELRKKRKILYQLLRKARDTAGISQKEIAEKVGRPQSFVSKYESGERRLDLIEVIEVCKILGISVSNLIECLQKDDV